MTRKATRYTIAPEQLPNLCFTPLEQIAKALDVVRTVPPSEGVSQGEHAKAALLTTMIATKQIVDFLDPADIPRDGYTFLKDIRKITVLLRERLTDEDSLWSDVIEDANDYRILYAYKNLLVWRTATHKLLRRANTRSMRKSLVDSFVAVG